MDPRDLRIGNMLYAEDEIVIVVAIDGKEEDEFDVYVGNGHGKVIKVKPSQMIIRPIPLTDEFVLKSGLFNEYGKLKFDVKGEPYSLRRENGHVVLMSGKNEQLIHFWEVKYLHRLQNLYYVLAKEELKIKRD